MDGYRLTTKSQEALNQAVHAAAEAGHPHVEPAHLLMALLQQSDGTALPLLRAVGVNPVALQGDVREILDRLPRASGATVAPPGLDRPSIQVLNAAAKEAAELGDEYVSTEHLLVGLAGKAAPSPRCCGVTAPHRRISSPHSNGSAATRGSPVPTRSRRIKRSRNTASI